MTYSLVALGQEGPDYSWSPHGVSKPGAAINRRGSLCMHKLGIGSVAQMNRWFFFYAQEELRVRLLYLHGAGCGPIFGDGKGLSSVAQG